MCIASWIFVSDIQTERFWFLIDIWNFYQYNQTKLALFRNIEHAEMDLFKLIGAQREPMFECIWLLDLCIFFLDYVDMENIHVDFALKPGALEE